MPISLLLVIMWLLPAAIAGLLGWNGIWGSGSAFGDYLIPIPVAGGALHVPSFALAASLAVGLKKAGPRAASWLQTLSIATALTAAALALDYDRLHSALFTDYEPYGSMLRLSKNPLLLFVGCDALCLAIYCRTLGYKAPMLWLTPVAPLLAIAITLTTFHQASGGIEMGRPIPTQARGNVQYFHFSRSPFDEAIYRDWIDEKMAYAMPQQSPNAENVAVHFSTSKQAIEYMDVDAARASTIGTFCFHESASDEQPRGRVFSGYADCFKDRPTFESKLTLAFKNTDTGYGRSVDQWYAAASLCEGVEVPERTRFQIALVDHCRAQIRRYPGFLEKVSADPEGQGALAFITNAARQFGLTKD